MSDPIETLCTVLLDIAKTSPGANINDVMAQVKTALDQDSKLTNALQTDTRMLQINLGQSKGYQVLVEGNATAYIGDRLFEDDVRFLSPMNLCFNQKF
jgi:hypothetical protein